MTPKNNHSDNLYDGQAPLDDEQLWDLLSLYVDGEADPAQAAIVEQMLSSDPAYRRDFDFLMASSHTMHMVDEVEPPVSLREAVYAATTRRPTLVGRLRAAWSRATTPAFGRYATVAGAFAAAALAVAVIWPHNNGSHAIQTGAPQVAVVSPVRPGTSVAVITPTAVPHDDKRENVVKPTPKLPEHKEEVAQNRSNREIVVPDLTLHDNKALEKSRTKMAGATPNSNHVAKNSASHSDSSGGSQVSGPTYSYERKMDANVAPDHPRTIVATNNDFGPEVAPSEDASAPTSSTGGAASAVASNQGHTEDSATTVKPEPPKPHIRIVALPPADKQVLAEAVLRKNLNMKNEGYNRAVADNMQGHDGLTLFKGSF